MREKFWTQNCTLCICVFNFRQNNPMVKKINTEIISAWEKGPKTSEFSEGDENIALKRGEVYMDLFICLTCTVKVYALQCMYIFTKKKNLKKIKWVEVGKGSKYRWSWSSTWLVVEAWWQVYIFYFYVFNSICINVQYSFTVLAQDLVYLWTGREG